MSFDTSPVPGTPAEFIEMLTIADACGPDVIVSPHPPRSWVWPHDPIGWIIGTDSWHVVLTPRLMPEGVVWLMDYGDDDGNREFPVSIEHVIDLVKLHAPVADPGDDERPRSE